MWKVPPNLRPPCGERACPALGREAALKPVSRFYQKECGGLIGAASQPNAGQARSPQLARLPQQPTCHNQSVCHNSPLGTEVRFPHGIFIAGNKLTAEGL